MEEEEIARARCLNAINPAFDISPSPRSLSSFPVKPRFLPEVNLSRSIGDDNIASDWHRQSRDVGEVKKFWFAITKDFLDLFARFLCTAP